MELTNIIRKPVITEKTNDQQNSNVYTFEVDYAANKYQIKKAVEFIFQVKVLWVNTQKVEKKPARLGRFDGFLNRYKKAIVKLADGYSISYYPQEEAEKEKAAKKETAKKQEQEKAAKKDEELKAKIASKKAKKTTAKKAETKESKNKKDSDKKSKTTVKQSKTTTTKKTTTKKTTAKKADNKSKSKDK